MVGNSIRIGSNGEIMLAKSPGGGQWPYVSIEKDGAVKKLPLQGGGGPPVTVFAFFWSTTGFLVAGIGGVCEDDLVAWAVPSGEMVQKLKIDEAEYAVNASTPEIAVFRGEPDRIEFFSLPDGKPSSIPLFDGVIDDLPNLALCDQWVALIESTGKISLIPRTQGHKDRQLRMPWPFRAIESTAAAPNGKYLAVCGKDGSVVVINTMENSRRSLTPPSTRGFLSVRFSDDSKLLVMQHRDERLDVVLDSGTWSKMPQAT